MTPDLQSTLDAIDEVAVHRCGYCDTPLGPEAPSKYWCSPEHQTAWSEARSEALVGYREPTDLPQHVYNQVEDGSPETTPASSFLDYMAAILGMSPTGNWSRWLPMTGPPDPPQVRGHSADFVLIDEAFDEPREPFTHTMGDVVGELHYTLTVDTSALGRALRDAQAAADRMLFGDLATWQPIGLINSLKVSTTVEPDPERLTDGVEFDFDHPSTAALAAEEPPAPVMAPYPLDIAAIQRHIDGGYLIPERVRAARRIDPRKSR